MGNEVLPDAYRLGFAFVVVLVVFAVLVWGQKRR